MNPALSCIEDTLRRLLEDAKQAKETAAEQRGKTAEGFEVGRSEALTEALHTWANQLQTFGLTAQLDGTWEELCGFLASQGYLGADALPSKSLPPAGDISQGSKPLEATPASERY